MLMLGMRLGADPRVVVTTTGPTVSRDGRYIWYSRRQGDWQYNAIFPQYQLVVYDRETGTNTVMSDRRGVPRRRGRDSAREWPDRDPRRARPGSAP